MNPPETCPHCGAEQSYALTVGMAYACNTTWVTDRIHRRDERCYERQIETLRSTLRDCLPYLSTRRSVGEIEARERALAVLGVTELEPTEPK